MNNKLINNQNGQGAIEMTAAIIAVSVFLLGSVSIFIWFNKMLVERQEYYESTRTEAATWEKPGIYEHQPQELDIFNP